MKIQSRLGVTIPEAASSGTDHIAVTVNDGDTVNFTASGTDNQTITAEVIIDPAVDNITVATTNGIYTKLIDEVTYAELAALISGSDLIQGRQYLITDYQTVHTIPGTADTNTGITEPLIVTAISTNDLEPVAYSTVYKDDIVYYDHVNNSKVNGSTKGCIYRRIDTLNNSDIPFDWRAVKFRRWQIDVDTVFDIGATYALGDVILDANNTTIWISLINGNIGNTPTDIDGYWRKFEWDNLEYVSHSSVSMILNTLVPQPITIPVTANYQDILSITSATRVTMSYKRYSGLDILASNNSCFGDLLDTTINCTTNFRNNHINDITYSDINVTLFYNNSIQAFSRNVIREEFYENSLYTFTHNHVLYTFRFNSFRKFDYNYCNGVDFTTNKQGSTQGISKNIFNSMISSNHMDKIGGDNFTFNEFHRGADVNNISFLSATHVFENYTTQTIQRSNNTLRLSYVDGTDTIIYSAVNA